MIADLKPYAVYTESGSTWLAHVPSHWEVRKLHTLFAQKTRDRTILPLLCRLPARKASLSVRLPISMRDHNVIPEDLTNYQVAPFTAINRGQQNERAWQGSMGIEHHAMESLALHISSLNFVLPTYAFGQYLPAQQTLCGSFLGRHRYGVRVGQWVIYPWHATNSCPCPSAIRTNRPSCASSTGQTNRLDRAIRAKRKVIALLNEQKQAIIHRADHTRS